MQFPADVYDLPQNEAPFMFPNQELTALQRLRMDAAALRDLEPHLQHGLIPGLSGWDAVIARLQGAPPHQRAALAQRILDDLLRARRLREERRARQPLTLRPLTSLDDGLDAALRHVLGIALGAFRWLADQHGWGALPVAPQWCLWQTVEAVEPAEAWDAAQHVADYVRAAAASDKRSYQETFRQGLVALSDMLDSLSPRRAAEREAWRPAPAERMPAAMLQITHEIAVDIGIRLEMPGNKWANVSLAQPAEIQDLELEMPL